MRRLNLFLLFLGFLAVIAGCGKKQETKLTSVGIMQFVTNPFSEQSIAGILKALEDAGYRNGENISIEVKNAQGDFPTVLAITQKFKSDRKDMIISVSTPCLQAAINSKFEGPIVFCSVANPILAGAGRTDTDHLPNVTGVPTTSPFHQSVELIREVFPSARKLGTLYVPAEVNSEYYMECAKEEAEKVGYEFVAIPVSATSEILDATQVLASKKIDVIYQISDNLSAAGFDSEVRVANENRIPLVANQVKQAEAGAFLAVGWDFFDVGYKAGEIAVRIINREDPAKIPFERMERVFIAVNKSAAKVQGVAIPASILEKADRIFGE